MPIYHLIIECCLELMHLRSSVLLLVVVIDGLQVTDDHSYDTRQLPLYSFVVLCLDEQVSMESFSQARHFIRALRFSFHHIYYGATFSSNEGHISLPCWLHVCLFLVFPMH